MVSIGSSSSSKASLNTTSTQSTMPDLLNFRDLGVSTADNDAGKQYIKEGFIFRSASLDKLTQQNVEDFIKEHNIRTIIDLRSTVEGGEHVPIDQSFPTTAIQKVRKTDLVADAPIINVDTNHPKEEKPNVIVERGKQLQSQVLRKKYRIDFAGRNFQRSCIWMSCTLRLKVIIIVLMILCQRKKAAVYVAREVLTPMGVANMYKQFVTYCQSEILEALQVFTDPENYPIHVHCTQGKDRTGLVSCLIEYIAGVPEDIIVKDYAKTQAGLEPIRTEMLVDLKNAGLSEEFANAPPKFMEELLGFLKEKYGSVTGFLDHIGFNEASRQQVRDIIVA
ncbi:protein-tyrosine phosphatase-like protein [Radiomyces spectabilis]|uniref:protein-tyrosine phosphatase-like protein n=1 Tax=Radiomyces spectabilis TaxID=64574 RepID=UPI00221F7A2C|nr:protein-tyrosine phosphatase-like protein [Radiomyces spectabilis]KAI8393807.1 protein-tyrosine phosphatase-like protein [Radiomyces spectabilis]